jgi:hypothetical protein
VNRIKRLRLAAIALVYVLSFGFTFVTSGHAFTGIYTCVGGADVFVSSIMGAPSETISGLTYSPAAQSIVATWHTSSPSNGSLQCGGKADNAPNYEIAVTFHVHIVTGLASATGFSCSVTSGATTSSATTVTTAAAPTRTPVTTASLGPITTTTVHGDVLANFVSNDNSTYMTEDDGFGFTGSANAGANMQLGKLTNEATLAGVPVNLFTNFGPFATGTGTDGPGGASLTNKLTAIWGQGGNLYAFANREYATDSTIPNPSIVETAYAGNYMKSGDHGLTWSTWQNPQRTSPNGVLPNPLGSFQFATAAWAWCSPVRYAPDDGSDGQLTPGNRFDGGDGFMYVTCTDRNYNNSSNLYMFRIPRAAVSSASTGTLQYWTGPSSPASTDFINDANWSSSATGATAIYSAKDQVSAPDLFFLPGNNEYILQTWYNPGTMPVSSNSTWVISSGPTPAGPWTTILKQSFSPQGYYTPQALHRSFAMNTATTNVAVTDVFSGDYGSGFNTYYFPAYAALTFNPTSTTYVNTTFSEAASGNLAGTTPATCTNGCVGPWKLASGYRLDAPVGERSGHGDSQQRARPDKHRTNKLHNALDCNSSPD